MNKTSDNEDNNNNKSRKNFALGFTFSARITNKQTKFLYTNRLYSSPNQVSLAPSGFTLCSSKLIQLLELPPSYQHLQFNMRDISPVTVVYQQQYLKCDGGADLSLINGGGGSSSASTLAPDLMMMVVMVMTTDV